MSRDKKREKSRQRLLATRAQREQILPKRAANNLTSTRRPGIRHFEPISADGCTRFDYDTLGLERHRHNEPRYVTRSSLGWSKL